MGLNVSEQYSISILALEGKIMGGPEAGEINDQIHQMIDQRRTKIIIDMTKVEWMNSSGLGILIGAITTLKNNNGDLSLVNVSERVQNLLKITKLNDVFSIYPDLDSAVEAMK